MWEPRAKGSARPRCPPQRHGKGKKESASLPSPQSQQLHTTKMPPAVSCNMASELYPRLKLQGNQIRLLRLFPGVEGQLIECELILSSTDNAKAYEALAYE